MQWLTDLMFPGMSWMEIARVSSLGVMTLMLMISVAAVGAVDISMPDRAPSEKS